ncbi:MAG: XRE family transcriptional regulator [Clostridia bacterium]|nr:XRE family transcriptional regulator [Clostridia bacterium]
MDKNIKSSLAEKLITYRKEKNLTQSEIAEALGINRSTYAYYERSTTPPMGILRKLAQLFGTTVDELVGNPYRVRNTSGSDRITFHQDPPAYRTKSPEPEEKLSGDEKLLLARYQSLPQDLKQKVQDYVRDCEKAIK